MAYPCEQKARFGANPVRTALVPIIRSAMRCSSSATAGSRTSISMAGVVGVMTGIRRVGVLIAQVSMRASVA